MTESVLIGIIAGTLAGNLILGPLAICLWDWWEDRRRRRR